MQSDISKIIAGAILVFGIIFLYTQEVPYLQNTFNLQRLFISAVITGFLLGLLIGYLWSRNYKELLEKFQIFVGAILLSILLSPLLLSLANRHLQFKPAQLEKLELMRVESYSGSRFGRLQEAKENPDGFRVFLLRKGEVVRLQKAEVPFPGKAKGDLVEVPISRGLLGFEYVDWQ